MSTATETTSQTIWCPCCSEDMDSAQVVCWTCYRQSDRLTAGTWPDGMGSTFTLTAADIARYDALRAVRLGHGAL